MVIKTKNAPKENALVQQRPAYLTGAKVTSDDNFGIEDVVIPTVKLLQGTSEECSHFPDANPGTFWHTGADVSLGTNFEFVIAARRRKYLLQTPMFDDQGILARSDDGVSWDVLGEWDVRIDKNTKVTWTIANKNVKASGLLEWGSMVPGDSSSPPAATMFYEYLVLLCNATDAGAVMISLARSQLKHAKRGLNSKIAVAAQQNIPMQAIQFGASIKETKNSMGQSYFSWQFAGAGFVDQALYEICVDKKDMLRNAVARDEGSYDLPVTVDVKTDDVPY